MASKRKTLDQLDEEFKANDKKFAEKVKKLEAQHKKQQDAYYAKMNKLSAKHGASTRRLLKAAAKAKK